MEFQLSSNFVASTTATKMYYYTSIVSDWKMKIINSTYYKQLNDGTARQLSFPKFSYEVGDVQFVCWC